MRTRYHLSMVTLLALTPLSASAAEPGPGPTIEHQAIGRAAAHRPLEIRARITSNTNTAVYKPAVYVRAAGVPGFTRIDLEPVVNVPDLFAATMPAELTGAPLDYYLEAFDKDGNGPTRDGSASEPHHIEVTVEGPRLAIAKRLLKHTGEHISLDASRCYDPDGLPLRTQWRQLDGPPAPLEGSGTPVAAFTPAEEGLYTFEVSVTNGHAPPEVAQVVVEVHRSRRFIVGAGIEGLSPQDSLVLKDAKGSPFRTGTPWGPDLHLGVVLTDRWQIDVSVRYAITDSRSEADPNEVVNLRQVSVLVGARYDIPFDEFSLFPMLEVGNVRNFLLAQDDQVSERAVGAQALDLRLEIGADVPLGERFGFIATVGAEGELNTEPVLPFTAGINYQLADNATLWGLMTRAVFYVRF